MSIKAIQTHYKGFRFRSRLEARWAVLFDYVGVKWEYETEGFELDDTRWYLPDFWLPDFWSIAPKSMGGQVMQGVFFEVKPVLPSAIEIEKAQMMWVGGKPTLFILNIPDGQSDTPVIPLHFPDTQGAKGVWGKCGKCGSHQLAMRQGCLSCGNEELPLMFFGKKAMGVARSARFEYGESP